MKVTAYNPEVDHLEKAYIASYADAGATSLVLTNNNGFSNTDKILIGRMGQERSEIGTISGAISGNTNITVSATDFPHNVDDPVYKLEWDQIKFYRATSISGTYSSIATVDIDVDNEEGVTTYDDSGWDSSYYYKIAYYNSVTTNESELSDPIAATGYEELTAGDVIERHVRRVRDHGYAVLSEQEYLDIMDEVNKDLITQARKPWDFLKRSTTLSTTASQGYVSLSTITRLWKINFVTYDYLHGGTNRTWSFEKTGDRQNHVLSHKEFINRYENGNWTDSDDIRDIAFDRENDRILIGPSPATSRTNVLTVHYWKDFDPINSLGDIIETPNYLIYLYKMRAEFYYAKAETDGSFYKLAKEWETKYGAEIIKMQRYNKIDAGSSEQFKGPKGYRRRYYL